MKKIFLLLFFAFISSVAFAETYTVKDVIDVGTLKLTNGDTVRLIGVEVPKDEKMGQEATEFVKGLFNEGQEVRLEFDVEKRDKYGRLLAYVWYEGERIIIHNQNPSPECERKVFELKEKGTQIRKSRISYYETLYGFEIQRACQYWITDSILNATIIKAGYASPLVPSEVEGMTIPPNVKHADLFQELFHDAADNNRGLWAQDWKFGIEKGNGLRQEGE